MSLRSARAQLMSALTNAGIDTYYGWGAFSTPCARIFPAEPWVELSGLANGARTQRWEVWAVAGRVDGGATFDEMEALVQDINAAISMMAGWSYVAWHRPVSSDMGGTRYLASRGDIETKAEA